MDRLPLCVTTEMVSIPHARGDGPSPQSRSVSATSYSPRPWGWTVQVRLPPDTPGVFPTPVGMDRCCTRAQCPPTSIPHARGDGPGVANVGYDTPAYSPRPWGWTDRRAILEWPDVVFPTPVGMDRGAQGGCATAGGTPHARGDGPAPGRDSDSCVGYSPRPWGWTEAEDYDDFDPGVFPTPVGMDRD